MPVLPRIAMAAVRRAFTRSLMTAFILTFAPVAMAQPAPADGSDTRIPYAESITVDAIRADEEVPVTTSEISRERLDEIDDGQDVPLILTRTPSVVAWADAGAGGSGYSYFSLRGIGINRINMTLDGVPLNDPAESALYFANFTDFASNVQSVQIQRGVGTSSVGAASYGGSINFESLTPRSEESIEGYLGGGSFGQQRASLAWHSGTFAERWRTYLRGSYNSSDGYREHSGVDQHSFWFGAERQGDRALLRVFAFSGRERSELAFYAVEEAVLREQPRFNPLDPAETDDFGQDLVKVEVAMPLSMTSSVSATAYYHGAQGWFDIFADPSDRESLQRFSIDGHTVGLIGTWQRVAGALTTDVGVHVNDFTRDHFMEMGGARQYVNTGDKNEASAFVKVTWQRASWVLFGDAQLRWSKFAYDGDLDLGSVDWTFFNPKLGARYRLSEAFSVYGSLARSEREPARSDLLFGEDNASIPYDLEAVRPERVVDLELGLDWETSNIKLSSNIYAMEFRDEIALTGELSEIGLPTRRNVDRSWRRGVELEAAWRFAPEWILRPAVNLSRNRIEEWTQFYDVYDDDFNYLGTESRTHRDVEPLLSPEQIINLGLEWDPSRPWSMTANARWVGESHLDNTGDDRFVTPAYAQLDLGGSVDLESWLGASAPTLRAQVWNLTGNDEIWPSGYSYPYLLRDGGMESIEGINYYYPMSGRSFSFTLEWDL